MKKVTLALILLISIVTNALADCRPDYKAEITKQMGKLASAKKWGRIVTGSSMGGMTLFWGTMGVLLVGPAGVLIGAQFGLLGGLVGIPFYIRNKVKKRRLSDLTNAYYAIEQNYSQNISDKNEALVAFYQKVSKKKPELKFEEFKMTLQLLNENRSLCNGTINQKSYPATQRQLVKYLINR